MDPARISEHLSLAEFLHTNIRACIEEQEREWRAVPGLLVAARRMAERVFEPVRALIGPLRVTSGYRCASLNAMVGGRPNSRHMLGLAVDCQPIAIDNREAVRRIVLAFEAGALPDVDEAIVEMGWLHLQAAQVGAEPRRLALETNDGIHFRPFDRTRIA